MKKLFLIAILALFSSQTVNASHILGGEIRWECLSNGRYVFFAKLFRDCTGADVQFNNSFGTLTVVGNPLPRSINNGTIGSIVMKPDSNTWQNNRNGDTSPTCAPGGTTITCPGRDPGAVQQFFWQSDPIVLRGTPPSGGWKFYMTPPCCRPGVTNLLNSSTSRMVLRAIMYPDRNNTPVDNCIDSSPEFLALPTNLICRGYEFTYNHTAIDKDLDSLVYAWDRSLNGPPTAPTPAPYAPGYNFNNPTPDKTFSNLNTPATLDPITGQIKVGVYSGGPLSQDYLTVVRVDAWREGRVIASVFREIPFVFFDCPRLANGQINKKPEIFIDGDSAEGVIVPIVAGQTVRIPFQAQDLDVSSGFPGLQRITVEPAGFMFSRDLQDPRFCLYKLPPGTPANEPISCAYLQNQDPVFNGTAEPPRFELSGYLGIATEFVWETKCHHIATVGTGVPGQNEGIYNFVMRTYDDHCPIPGINYPTITVKIRDPFPLTEPVMKGVSVGLDGRLTYQWVPPMDSAYTFFEYNVEVSRVLNGQTPSIYQPLRNNGLKKYQQEQRNAGYQIFNTVPGNPNDWNILSPFPGQDYFIRMTTLSGCRRDVPSLPSQPAQVMELDVVPSGNPPTIPLRAEAQLTWNAPKPSNANSYPYFEYESPTTYYVWTNDQIDAQGNNIDVASNWTLRGNTRNLTLELPATSCAGFIGFRVEARDTVVTYKQGQGLVPPRDSLDTLVFSTFSTVDTMYMVNPGILPQPVLDTIEVLANGNVNLRLNTEALNVGTAGRWRVFRDAVAPANLIDSFIKPVDSIILTTVDNSTTSGNYVIEAIDDCNASVRSVSNVYSTNLVSGSLPAVACNPTYNLSWNVPNGFTTNIQGYRVYRRVREGAATTYTNWEFITSVSGANTTTAVVPRKRNTDYIFKVEAFDARGASNISAEHFYTRRQDRSFEIVRSPELRCAYVEVDGSVTLSFIPADPNLFPGVDTTANWVSYQFEYRQGNGAWTVFPGSGASAQSADSVKITGIDAINNVYQFRATTLSGCSGSETAPYSFINLIVPTATAVVGSPNKDVNITWTDNGLSDNPSADFLYVNQDQDPDSVFTIEGLVARVEDVDPNFAVDATNGNFCDTINTYHIIKMDQLTGCLNRSVPDTARVIDQIPPPPQLIDYLSYDVNSDALIASWTWDQLTDIDSLIFFHPDLTTGQNQILTREAVDKPLVNGRRFTIIPQNLIDASDSSVVIGVQSKDVCGRLAIDFAQFDYHRSIDVEIDWDPCDSTLNLDWNSYTDFHSNAETEYLIQQIIPDPAQLPNIVWVPVAQFGPISDTTVSLNVAAEGTFNFRVLAKPTDETSYFVSSNRESGVAIFNPVPAFNYIHYVTVNPTKEVELQLYKDTAIEVGGYQILRGRNELDMSVIGNLGPNNNNSLVLFEDLNAETDIESYIYQIIVDNECGNPIDTTNVGTSIHLVVQAQSEAIQNVLYWNNYEGWDSTVAYYNIYRGINGNGANTLYTTVTPSEDGELNVYVDKVFDNTYAVGDYCYRVEAVQGPINPQFQPKLASATSNSNEVCVTQQPKFYVPNAFAPDGLNKVFIPQGQFFDFTLFEMVIYNRWGELVYETRDINKGWDGTKDGDLVQVGSYVYMIRFVDADGKEHRRKGTVTVIR